MNRPVVIVDPLSSGIELAPALAARGMPAIAVTLKPFDWNGFGAKIRKSDFVEIIPNQENLVEVLRKYNPLAVVMPVFLNSPAHGKISNAEELADVSKLPTFLNENIWFKNGDVVPQTVDYLTSIGIVALAGDRQQALLDYGKIRNMESKLVIEKV